MIDIEKKKRVAAKLREWADMPDSDEPCDILNFGDVVLDILRCGDSHYECFMALAELIEPDCNRNALLALADEIETNGVDRYTVSTQYVLDDYAQRIREACGVSE